MSEKFTLPNAEPFETLLKYDDQSNSFSQRKRIVYLDYDDVKDLDTKLQQVVYVPRVKLSDRVQLHAPLDTTAIFLFSSFINWSDNPQQASQITSEAMTYGNAIVYRGPNGAIMPTDLMPVVVTDNQQSRVYYLDSQGVFHTQNGSFKFDNNKRVDVDGLIYDNLFMFAIDNNEPITQSVFNLLLQYDASLLANEKSLKRFAESILVLTGNTSNQKLSDEDYRKMVNSLIINLMPTTNGNGDLGATPTADFISPPINTEAREAWSNRLRFEILRGLMMIDFTDIGGNPSSYTMSIYAYPTLKRAENIGDQILQQMRVLLELPELNFKVELPSDATQTMNALNTVEFISTETKIRESFPDWTDEQVANELQRLSIEKGGTASVANALDTVLGSENG